MHGSPSPLPIQPKSHSIAVPLKTPLPLLSFPSHLISPLFSGSPRRPRSPGEWSRSGCFGGLAALKKFVRRRRRRRRRLCLRSRSRNCNAVFPKGRPTGASGAQNPPLECFTTASQNRTFSSQVLGPLDIRQDVQLAMRAKGTLTANCLLHYHH